jgi:lipopolysaccharide transport system ATP-binding protein
MRREEIRRKFDEIVAFAEIEKFLDTPVKRYSSGMYVRLAFAVAAHLEPEILVVDEVLAVGDAQFQKKCLGKMSEVAKQGRTVLFVSHNMAAVQVLCQRGIVLNQGKCVGDMAASNAVSLYLASATESGQLGCYKSLRTVGIREVYFRNDRRKKTSTVLVGMSLDICIDYSLPRQASGLGFSIVFRGILGEPVTCCHSISVRGPMSYESNDGIAVCHIPRLPLMPGEYLLDVSLDQRGALIEILHQALRVIVDQGDFYGSGRIPPSGYGHVLMEHSWSVELLV